MSHFGLHLYEKLFKDYNDNFITSVAYNVQEACALAETGFDYVTGDTTRAAKSSANAYRHLSPDSGRGWENQHEKVAGVR